MLQIWFANLSSMLLVYNNDVLFLFFHILLTSTLNIAAVLK